MKNAASIAALLLLSLAAGCGGGQSEEATEAGLSSAGRSFVSVRADLRKCPAPACGGYFVRDANRNGAEVYVAALDFSASSLDAAWIGKVLAAPAAELVLYGKLSAVDARKGRSFLVSEAYRGMPGAAPRQGDALYATSAGPAAACVTAPCMTAQATPLNATAGVPISSFALGAASSAFVDEQWLEGRVRSHGAVAAGAVVQGAKLPGGVEQVLAASQVFLKLPDAAGPCPAMPLNYQCKPGEVLAYSRTVDRCLMPAGCVKQVACSRELPACAAGYRLATWAALPDGCPHAVCEPAFIE